MEAHPICRTLSWRGLNPIKLANTARVGQMSGSVKSQFCVKLKNFNLRKYSQSDKFVLNSQI